jgi:hypothetical protein
MRETKNKKMAVFNFLQQILNFPERNEQEKEKKFWILFDWCKRELFSFLKDRITNIKWKKNWLKELEEVHEELIYKWREIENKCQNYQQLKRLKGVIYEPLFYLNSLYTGSIFKGSWIMEVAGDSLIPNLLPPWLEIIPLYDIVPKVFRIKKRNRWELRAPQIEADFLIYYYDERKRKEKINKRKLFPLAFIDIKSSLKNYNPREAVWHALGCKMFQNSILQIAIPQKEFPQHLKDWKELQVCWNCGKLHDMEKSVYCIHCGKKIWLAEKEFWEPYPFK